MSRRHLVIPDLQVRPGVPLDHLTWIGRYAAEKKPDVIILLGDVFDMASLSSYDKGKKVFEGRRYRDDIAAGNHAFELLNAPIDERIATDRRAKRKAWNPEREYLLGNHEERILRAINSEAILEGTIGFEDFKHPGWTRHDFLEIVWIDGVAYSHYFTPPLSSRPYSGTSIDLRLKNIGHSFTAGHQQLLMFGRHETAAGARYGLVAGACYLHDEDYRGPQSNNEWRGIIMKNEVRNGTYDPSFISLDFLCRKYERLPLEVFMEQRAA